MFLFLLGGSGCGGTAFPLLARKGGGLKKSALLNLSREPTERMFALLAGEGGAYGKGGWEIVLPLSDR